MITLRNLKRIIVIVFGMTVLLIGVALVPFPGPGGLPVIIAGLALLAGEFVWAAWALKKVKSGMRQMNHMIRGGPPAQENRPEPKPAETIDMKTRDIADRKPNTPR